MWNVGLKGLQGVKSVDLSLKLFSVLFHLFTLFGPKLTLNLAQMFYPNLHPWIDLQLIFEHA